jgi:hypothetical protein
MRNYLDLREGNSRRPTKIHREGNSRRPTKIHREGNSRRPTKTHREGNSRRPTKIHNRELHVLFVRSYYVVKNGRDRLDV